jgi:hypothetical protein
MGWLCRLVGIDPAQPLHTKREMQDPFANLEVAIALFIARIAMYGLFMERKLDKPIGMSYICPITSNMGYI